MHWCHRNLFSACHTHHNKCTYTRACTSLLAVQSLLCHKTIADNLRILKSSFRLTANTKHWVEPWWRFSWTEHPHRACWLKTPDFRAAPTRHLRPTSCMCWPHPFLPPRKLSNFTPAHDAVAAALSHKHHPIIHVGHDTIDVRHTWLFSASSPAKKDDQHKKRHSLCDARKEKTRELQMKSPHYFSNNDNKKPNAIINRKTTFLNEEVSE